jgi:threonine/homoserine/homoserine lactone efflux protein
MLTYFLLGAGIGLISGVSPGPVLTLVVAETLKGGWLRGAAVASGPLLADGPIVVAALTVLAQLPIGFVPVISVVGGAFLVYLAVTIALSSRRAMLPRGQRLSPRGGFVTGLLARALGPHPYLFWFLVGGPILIEANHDSWTAAGAFLVGYYLTVVGSNVGLALVLHRWIGLVSDRLYRGLLLVSSLILAAYAALLVGQGIQAAHARTR